MLAPTNADGHCFSASLTEGPESRVQDTFPSAQNIRWALVIHFAWKETGPDVGMDPNLQPVSNALV